MSGLQFVASIVQSLAWPAVVVVVVVVLKEPLRSLVGRIRSAKGYGVELSFEKAADEVRAAVAEIDETTERHGQSAAQRPEAAPKPFQVPQDVDPTYMVLLAWQRVEESVVKLAKRAGVEPVSGGYTSPAAVVRALSDKGVIQDSYAVAVRSLGSLRNAVAHGQRSVMPAEAMAFVTSATEIVRVTDALMERGVQPPAAHPAGAA